MEFKYINPSEAKFSAIMDLLNRHIIDGELGNFRQSERELMKSNTMKFNGLLLILKIQFWQWDRGYASFRINGLDEGIKHQICT